MKLVVGLGNPGKQYTYTRHNIGFRILDSIVSDWQLMPKASALICKQGDVIYAKPQTFMNLSGASVLALIQYYKIDPLNMLVIYDDKDIPFGTLRFRATGSSGGHNGMNSIIPSLGTQEFPRLRFGIATEEMEKYDTADFVLAKFTKEEEKQLPEIIEQAVEEIEKFTKITST